MRGCSGMTTGSSDAQQQLDEGAEARGVVDGARAVSRDEHVLPGLHAGVAQRAVVGASARRQQASDVDHDVADDLHRGAVDALAGEVVGGVLRGDEQEVRRRGR